MNFLRKAAWATALAPVLIGAPAFAADLPVYEPPAPAPVLPVAQEYKPWQGLSVGVIGTYGLNGKEKDLTHLNSLDGPMVGGIIGLHNQIGNWVLGAEFDGSFGSISDSRGYKKDKDKDKDKKKAGADLPSYDKWTQDELTKRTEDYNKGTYGFRSKAKLDELYTVRANLGYAFDNVLIYGTGGLGIAHAKINAENPVDGLIKDDGYGFAPVFGGGVNYKVTDNFGLGVQYLYMTGFDVGMKANKIRYNAVGNKVDLEKETNRVNAEFEGTHMIRVMGTYHLPIN